jgi:Flp pilus assembly protein TadG
VSARAGARFLRDAKGTSAVEFAIIAPAFFLLLVGVFEVGWAGHKLSSLRFALQESGRVLLVTPTMSATDFDALVKSKLSDIADPNVTTSLVVDAPSGGVKLAHATATYNFTISVPMLPERSFSYQTAITVPLRQ